MDQLEQSSFTSWISEHGRSLLPGVSLCLAISAAAFGLEAIEHRLFGKAWLEALVVAILIGTGIRSFWTPAPVWRDGISFSAKYLLEIAVVLLGASVSAATIFAAGYGLLLGIAGVVATAIVVSFAIGYLLGLPPRMALLAACGNSICGNSAIAAVAPVIGANSKDVATSIAFTAVLGIVVVLVLPLLGVVLGMGDLAYGAFAGLTVYAVPQVLAAASPFGATAVQMATMVKLMRVLMLGPVCLVLALLTRHFAPDAKPDGDAVAGERPSRKLTLANLVPWFIVGFLAMVVLRSLGIVPTAAVAAISHAATLLTVISMAALGLGVDVQTVAKAGLRVVATVVLSLIALGAISLALLNVLNL